MAKTVVLIDDDLDDLEMMRYVLKKSDPNIYCISFSNPVEAIKQLSYEKLSVPDYIFIDVNMPMLSGSECLKELRRIEKYKNAFIIIFSTSMPESAATVFKKDGATCTFQKPATLNGYSKILKGLDIIR